MGAAGAAVFAGQTVDAAANTSDFGIENGPGALTVRFSPDCCVGPVEFRIPKIYWSGSATFKVMDAPAAASPDGEVRRTASIAIAGARFAGNHAFAAVFEFVLVGPDCQMRLVLTDWPKPGRTAFASIGFVDFVEGRPLAMRLSRLQRSELLKAAFGDAVTLAGGAVLSLASDLVWTLTADASDGLLAFRNMQPDVAHAKVRFKALRLAPTAPAAGTIDDEILAAAFVGPATRGLAFCGVSAGALAVSERFGIGRAGETRIVAVVRSSAVMAFEQHGDPRATVTAIRADVDVIMVTGALIEGPFRCRNGRIARYGVAGSKGLARLPLDTKPFKIDTSHGSFVIEAADPARPRPGAPSTSPGIALATGEFGTVAGIEIRALLRQAFLTFPETKDGTGRDFFSRMDFAGEECRFLLSPATGRAGEGSEIRLAAQRATDGGWLGAPVRLSLDRAVLRVVRPRDLLSLTFRFSGVDLAAFDTGARVLPRTAACGARLFGRPAAPIDDRPIMVVEFPPQHVAERAYLRQIADGGDPPDVALDATVIESLRDAFATVASFRAGVAVDVDLRVRARRAIQDAKRQAEDRLAPAAPPPGSGPTFSTFCDAFERAIDDAAGLCLLEDQRVYIGSEWLDPDVRRTARAVVVEVMNRGRSATKVDPGEEFEADLPTESRLSGPSRLAFRIGCDDYDPELVDLAGIRTPRPEQVRGAFDFTLAALTDWSRFDLAVVRRAEKVFDFERSGRLPHRWTRRQVNDAATTLAFQGIPPAVPRLLRKTTMTAAKRLDDVFAAANMPPRAFETSIELPYRLMLSPAQDARWRTPRIPFAGDCGPIALWQATLEEDSTMGSVRAVWSDDFRPEVFTGACVEMDYSEAEPRGTAGAHFRAAMAPADRHEIVALTSVYGLPVAPNLKDGGQIEPPPGYALTDHLPEREAIYMPRPLEVAELALSSLGGALDCDTHLEPPAAPKRREGDPTLFPTFTVERWRHLAVLGRDVSVEVVYRGYLFPLGNRASFVKVTERRIMRHPRGGPVAYLVQRLFVRVSSPTKEFPALGQPDGGRRFPARQIVILTLQTPDLVDPRRLKGTPLEADQPAPPASCKSDSEPDKAARTMGTATIEDANGAVLLPDGLGAKRPGLVFWPRTGPGPGSNILFDFQIDGAGGSVAMPLLFLDNAAVEDAGTVRAAAAYYNGVAAGLRTLDHRGTPRRYAVEARSGDATLETSSWTLEAEGGRSGSVPSSTADNADFNRSAPLRGDNQPPFYPLVAEARARFRQVAKLTGGPPPEAILRYFEPYRRDGFEEGGSNPSHVFLEVIGPAVRPRVDFGSSGDRSGPGRPEYQIAAVSRKNGPIGAGAPVPAAAPKGAATVAAATDFSSFDPKSFFGSFGKLLGILDLGTVIEIVAGLSGMPKLQETLEYVSDQSWTIVRGDVLVPLDEALGAIDKVWSAVMAGRAGPAADGLAGLYPEVWRAKKDLLAAVEAALAAQEPALDAQAVLIARTFEAARAFIDALKLLASDPIGRIETSLRNTFEKGTESLSASVSAQLADWKGVGNAVAGFLADIAQTPFVGLLFSFDWLADLPKGETARLRIRGAIPGALHDFPGRFVAEAMALGGSVTEVSLKTTAIRTMRDILNDPDLDLALGDAVVTQRADQVEGILFGRLRAALVGILEPAFDVYAQVASTASGRLDALPKVLKRLGDALRGTTILFGLVPAVTGALETTCDALVDMVGDLLDAVNVPAVDASAATISGIGAIGACVSGKQTSCSEAGKSCALAARLLDDLAVLHATEAGSPLRAWADATLRGSQAALDGFAFALEDLLQAAAVLTPADRHAIKAACLQLDLDALVKPLKKVADARKPVLDAAELVASNLVGSLGDLKKIQDAPGTSGGRADSGRAALAVLDILDALFSLSLDPAGSAFVAAVAKAKIVIAGFDDGSYHALAVGPVQSFRTAIKAIGDHPDRLGAIDEAVALLGAVSQASTAINRAERRLLTEIGPAVLASSGAANRLAEGLRKVAIPLVAAVSAVYATVRNGVAGALPALTSIAALPGIGLAVAPLRDRLADPKRRLDAAIAALASDGRLLAGPIDPDPVKGAVAYAAFRTALADLAVQVGPGNPLAAMVDAIAGISRAILKGDIANLIDLDAPRREVEALIRDLIPHKATLAYAFDNQLEPFAGIFIPDDERGDRRLTIDVKTVVDLRGTDPPATTVAGTLDPFNIHLFGSTLDVVTLKFKKASFASGPGPFAMTLDLESVELGEAVEFLQALQSYLTPSDGNGFYIRPASGVPGIEVGYGLNLGTISLGPVSFINVGLNAGCRLPFDKSNALFTISLSRPGSPFLISAGIYGGGGYLGLIANGTSIVGFEASFEFGGVSAFSFGPLTGIGRLTTGIFVRKLGAYTTIDGFFFAGGSAKIACFGISASLSVSISMQPGGAMSGQATFTFSFSIGFAHVSFHVAVVKSQGKLGSSADAAPVGHTRYASLDSGLARATPGSARKESPGTPRVHARTTSPGRDWRTYQTYFAHDLAPGDGS